MANTAKQDQVMRFKNVLYGLRVAGCAGASGDELNQFAREMRGMSNDELQKQSDTFRKALEK